MHRTIYCSPCSWRMPRRYYISSKCTRNALASGVASHTMGCCWFSKDCASRSQNGEHFDIQPFRRFMECHQHWLDGAPCLKVLPERLNLVSIDKNHPWASDRWLLPLSTLKSLTRSGSKLLHLQHDANIEKRISGLLHKNHRSADTRWSHAKLYSLKRGNSQRLIVTSANFSTSAWGSESQDGQLTIENFELGVCIEQTAWHLFDNLDEFEKLSNAATVPKLPTEVRR